MSKAADEFDVIVIGAGAAGMAAAAHLSRHHKSVCILEARERVGGRIFTIRPRGNAFPLELGAEFIHGESEAVFEQLRRSGDVAVDAAHSRHRARQPGELKQAEDLFENMRERLSRIPKPRSDLPFAEFLEKHRRSLSPEIRAFATMLVQGFDAADPARASAKEILKEWAGGISADAPTFRPQRGYGSIIDSLVGRLDPQKVCLQLHSIVTEVRWQRGQAHVLFTRHGEPMEVRAKQAIVTLPLGVMQLPPLAPGSVLFSPALPRKQQPLSRLIMGPVIKLALCFSKPFWAEIEDGRHRDVAFFHAQGAPFPTFWSTLPVRSSVLYAWSGGPNASRIVARTTDEVLRPALASLAQLFGKNRNYRRLLEGVYWHDWQNDPYSCGAYGYAGVNGGPARKQLAQPVEQTLFFAGEAMDEEESSSVGGALNTGCQAAEQVLASE
ncbi:MAG: NAD(P)/FAD-dependent oxidoreductase [Steroidobacter sp.]